MKMKRLLASLLLAFALLSGGCLSDLSFVEQLAVVAGEMIAWEALDTALDGRDKTAIEEYNREQEEKERAGNYGGP